MPVLWRFLLVNYTKVFILSVLTFIAILLTTRMEEIAHFATLGPQGLHFITFIIHQIPYVLPIAIPISALISGMTLTRQMSTSHELVALRASGFGLQDILAPILLFSLFVAVFNLYIISELSTNSHLQGNILKAEVRSVNPLLLVHNKHLLKLKGIYFDVLGSSKVGESASDVILACPTSSRDHIHVMIAKQLEVDSSDFTGQNLTVFSTLPNTEKSPFSRVAVENVQTSQSTVQDFSQFFQKKTSIVNNDQLELFVLLSKLSEEQTTLKQARENKESQNELKKIQREITRIHSEFYRRISVGIAVFSFALLGTSFGMSIGRGRSQKKVFTVFLLASFYLGGFFVAKGIDHLAVASFIAYFFPHFLIVLASIHTLYKISRGIE